MPVILFKMEVLKIQNSSVNCGPNELTASVIHIDLLLGQVLEGLPSVITRSCTTSGGVYELGVNTIGSSPNVINSFNGTGNNRVVEGLIMVTIPLILLQRRRSKII